MAETDNKKRVLDLTRRAFKFVTPWHEGIERRRAKYNFDHYDVAPKPSEDQFQDPTYTNTVDLAVGVILGNGINWRVAGFESTPEEGEESSKIEKLLAGVLHVNSKRHGYHIPYEILLNFVRDGAAVLFSVWDELLSQEHYTEVRMLTEQGVVVRPAFMESPLNTQVIDPLKIGVLPGGPKGRWAVVVRKEKMSVYDVESTYGVEIRDHVGDTIEQKMDVKGELIDFWEYTGVEDEEGKQKLAVQNMVLFKDEIVYDMMVMPGYYCLPYRIGFFKPVDREEPSGWGHSVIDPLEHVVSMLEKSINRRSRQINVFSSLPLVIKAHTGRDVEIDGALGETVTITPEEDVGFPRWQGNPPDVREQIDFLRARTQQSGFSDVMYGSGAQQMAGYALSQLGDQNRIRLAQPVVHLQEFLEGWADDVLKLTSYYAEGAVMRVYGRQRGVDFIEQIVTEGIDEYLVLCQLKPEFPNEKTRKHAMSTQVRDVVSERTLLQDYLDIEQPDDEMTRRYHEMAMKHPSVLVYRLMKEFKKLQEAGDEDAAFIVQAFQSQLQRGMMPGTASPTRPGREQLTGTQSPTGQATPQAQGQPPPGQAEGSLLNELAGLSPGMTQGGL